MSKNIKILIIPDVHGRTFWREPVLDTLQDTDSRIIFLGDYHDPYPYEWDNDQEYLKNSVDRFREIVDLKKKYPDRIILLIGNHDCGYCIGQDICSSRMDFQHMRDLNEIFFDNREFFQLADECDIAGIHYVFTHAGILKGWADQVWGEDAVADPEFNVVEELNKAWMTKNHSVLNHLGDYDRYRGWGGYQYGSPVWSDVRSWIKVTPEETYGFNIVGHTQCEETPVVLDTIADLDCRKAFYIDDQGLIRDYDTEDILKKSMKSDEE